LVLCEKVVMLVVVVVVVVVVAEVGFEPTAFRLVASMDDVNEILRECCRL
jgi:ABC-type transporter Mla subunit MlaD